jgi:hypothetical protein
VVERDPSEPASDERLRRWHRLFGLLMSDHSRTRRSRWCRKWTYLQKQQLLDVVVVQRRSGKVTRPLPDGLLLPLAAFLGASYACPRCLRPQGWDHDGSRWRRADVATPKDED